MNIPIFALLFATFSTTWAAIANAEDWYLAGRLSAGLALMQDITHKGTIGTGASVGNDIDGSLVHENIEDVTGGIGLALGRRFGNWNVEAEFMWRSRTDWDIAATTYSLNAITNVFTNVETSTLLVNATRRIPINGNWAWEVAPESGWSPMTRKVSTSKGPCPGQPPSWFSRTMYVLRNLVGTPSSAFLASWARLGRLTCGIDMSTSATCTSAHSPHASARCSPTIRPTS